MHTYHKRHHYSGYQAPLHYAVLGLVIFTALLAFLQLRGQPQKQLILAMITAVAYAGWGIAHHGHEGDLHWKIVVEYTALSVLGLAMLWLLLSLSG